MPELKRLAGLMFRSCRQQIDEFGGQGEQIQQTNFSQFEAQFEAQLEAKRFRELGVR